jgi:hypothetical protein
MIYPNFLHLSLRAYYGDEYDDDDEYGGDDQFPSSVAT